MVRRRVLVTVLLVALPACSAVLGLRDLTPVDETADASDDAARDGSAPSDANAADAADASDTDASCETLSDPANCGRCGHSCLGGACTKGRCEPVVLATGQGDVSGISVDATHVYFTSLAPSVVARVPKGGGAVTPLASGAAVRLPKRVAVDGAHVYWVSSELFDGAVARCPLGGCTAAPEVLASPEEPVGVAVAGGHVYWADHNGKRIGRRLLGGAADDAYAVPPDLPVAVAVSGADVVYIADFSGQVHRRGAGGENVLVGANGQSGRDVVLHGGFAYWGAAEDPGMPGRIARAPVAGGGASELVSVAGGEPMALAVDDTYVYWTAWSRLADGGAVSGGVHACPHAGCAGASSLLTTASFPRGIAVDESAIYFAASGGVLKLAKP